MSDLEQEPHNRVADRLDSVLLDAAHPNADFQRLAGAISNADHDVHGPNINHLAISNAKSAVEHCMGPKKLGKYRAEADAKIASLRIVGNHIASNA